MATATETRPPAITEEYAPFGVTGDYREMGRSFVRVQCHKCGAITRCYLWSWAGHGFRRCEGCRRKLRYLDLT